MTVLSESLMSQIKFIYLVPDNFSYSIDTVSCLLVDRSVAGVGLVLGQEGDGVVVGLGRTFKVNVQLIGVFFYC